MAPDLAAHNRRVDLHIGSASVPETAQLSPRRSCLDITRAMAGGRTFRYPVSGHRHHPEEARTPPSGWSIVPVTQDERFEARNSAQLPMSSYLPRRPAGIETPLEIREPSSS